MASSVLIGILVLITSVAGTSIKKKQQTTLNRIDVNWEAPTDIKNRFMYYKSGYDYDDIPVIVMEYGNWDFQGAAEKGGKDLEIADLFIDQLNARLLGGFFHEKSNMTDSIPVDKEIVAIVDFDGWNLSQFNSPPTLKWMLDRLSKMGIIYKTISYGFIVNANPLVYQMINTVKPFISNFLEKVDIYGTNVNHWKTHLLKKIPPSELHPRYGGNQNFRPVSIYG
ncbi:unnamed protein product [Allacma fusca]|uniref:CRAL-TRIO domain-containing protein n=1 Tax=Allacma fusca TaxID=39272 RepID=A0A8J2JLF2_9HEXA|nr:unnamed protein product [Allacma fusca]